MTKIGYALSCEQFGPKELIDQAKRAEAAGFEALSISDHFHPWNDEQGQSPFVWGVIGALSEAVSLPVSTLVTCPTVRIHPAVLAQAAATDPVVYQQPPAPIAQILDTLPSPAPSLSPDSDTLALFDRSNLPPISELAEPMLRLGGYRINPRNTGPANSRVSKPANNQVNNPANSPAKESPARRVMERLVTGRDQVAKMVSSVLLVARAIY